MFMSREELREASSLKAYADMTEAELMAWDAFYLSRAGRFTRGSDPWIRLQQQREKIDYALKHRGR